MPTPRPAPINAPIARLPNRSPAPAPSAVPQSSPAGIAIVPQNGKPAARGAFFGSFTARSRSSMWDASTLLNDQLALGRLAQILVLVHGTVRSGHHSLQSVAALGVRSGADV